MEDNTHVLELVCQHFKTNYSDATICSLRKRLQNSYKRTSKVRHSLIEKEAQCAFLVILNRCLMRQLRTMTVELDLVNTEYANM